jgi:hypothetical protein
MHFQYLVSAMSHYKTSLLIYQQPDHFIQVAVLAG